MIRILLCFLLIATFATAQTKKPAAGKGKQPPKKDTVMTEAAPPDTIDERDVQIRASGQFAAYSKRTRTKKGRRTDLCINLVSEGKTLNKCYKDSILHDPETAKVLFEQKDGDTTYMLVFVDAFSKAVDKPSCDAGKETRLFFVRWNTGTNKAIWKSKTISSCMKGITNMTKFNVGEWTPSEPLVITYFKGGTDFVDIEFDPKDYKTGFQAAKDRPEEKEKEED